MATERKKRQAQKSTVDTSKLKEFASKHGGGESKGARRLRMAKSVKDEASKIQSQISREQEKAQKKSLWSSIGGALFGLAAGGKKVAETEGGAKREKIKSDLWYTPEAEKQNLAFDDYEKQLNKSIQDRALASGLLTAAVAGGGKLVEKIKEAKAAKAAKQLAEAKEAMGIPKALEEAKEGYEYIMASGAADASGTSITSATGVTKPKTFLDRDLSTLELVSDLKKNRPDLNLSNIEVVATESYGPSSTLDLVQARANELGAISEGLDMGMDLSSVKTVATGDSSILALRKEPLSTSIKSQFAAATPLTAKAAPTKTEFA